MTSARAFLLGILCLWAISAGAQITLVTFNCFWLFDDQPPHAARFTDNRPGQTPQQAIDGVAAVIHNMHADVVALQEIENATVLENLRTAIVVLGTTYPHSWIGQGTDNTTGQDVALLSMFPAAANTTPVFHFPDERESYDSDLDPGREENTGLSKALRVDLDVNGNTLTVFVFHLKSQIGDYKADEQRLAQGSIVRRLTLPLIRDRSDFVVMGDMNDDTGSRTLKRLRGLDDIEADLVQPYFDDDNFINDRWTHRFAGRHFAFDHILLSPTLRGDVSLGFVRYGHDLTVSDHFPLMVSIDF